MLAGTAVMALYRQQVLRELRLVLRARAEVLNPIVFLVLTVTLFALALDAQADALRRHAAGIFWVLVLLTNLLSFDQMFRRDYDDGSLEQLLLLAEVPFVAILGKMTVQWLGSGLLVVLLSPLLGTVLQMPPEALLPLALALLAGTPVVAALGAVGAALIVGVSRGGALLGLLVLPLYVPVLIFGTAAVNGLTDGLGGMAQIYWLAAMSVLAVTLSPFAVLAALRISLENR